ncbi:MAG: hypothetical protein HPY74_13890 [Firmicutes bacterium]|nr:hypothetical protein [Bacillota bacterium]
MFASGSAGHSPLREGIKMIFMCTSMYWEALPFIKQLNLKRDFKSHKFEIFKNEEIILIITGIGKVKAAVAVTYLFSKYEPEDSDLFMNIGVCGTKNRNIAIGTAFFCNKIIENDTKRTFYPDMLFKHTFEETSVETCSLVINKEDIELEGQLADMEASGIYQAASVFLQPHQISFIKVVSDYLNVEKLSKDKVSELIEDKTVQIISWMNEVKLGFSYERNILSQKEQEILNRVIKNLKLSYTMGMQFKQMVTYYKLQYGDFTDLISMYIDAECGSKNEGKRYFAEIKQKLV